LAAASRPTSVKIPWLIDEKASPKEAVSNRPATAVATSTKRIRLALPVCMGSTATERVVASSSSMTMPLRLKAARTGEATKVKRSK